MKISVLIPTYNRPYYLIEALESVLSQTMQPYEIIIADDNVRDREVNFNALLPYLQKYRNIKYVQNIKNLGGVGNYKNLFFLASGDYIKYLAEDDILYPDNLEKLSTYLNGDETIKVATSKRDVLDEEGCRLIEISASRALFEKDTVIDGKEIIRFSIESSSNYIGEFSTYMFRKVDVDVALFECCGQEFDTNADWFLWMILARKGKIAYIADPLSQFRYGLSNDQLSEYHRIEGFLEILFFTNDKFLDFVGVQINKFHTYEQLLNNYLSLIKNPVYDRRKVESLKDRLLETIKQESQQCEPKQIEKGASIIIVTYNNEETIYACIDSVLQYSRKIDEIIIVDNASTDSTLEIVKTLDDQRIKIVALKQNTGYAAGINNGIKKAKKEYYIFLNPDTIVTRYFVDKLLYPLVYSDIAATSAISTYVGGKIQTIKAHSKIAHFMQDLTYDEISDYLYCKNENRYILTKLLIGFCVATSKETIDRIGALDENLFLGNDDLDFSWRLQLAGLKQAVMTGCFIYHKGHESFHKSGSITEKLVEESTNVLAQKLIDYYGYGKVPLPEELWGFEEFYPTDPRYKFMFRFTNSNIDYQRIDREIENNRFSVAIILVNYQNWIDTKACVESLKDMEYKNFTVIIVDNSEVSVEVLKKYYGKEYKVLEEDEDIKDFSQHVVIRTVNLGFSHANNIAIKNVKEKFDYIWILNNDTLVVKNTLSHLLEVSLKTQSLAVTSKIKDYIDKEKVQYDGIVSRYTPMWDKLDRIKYAKFLSGANLLLKSDIFNKIGLWSECYFLYYDDNDFFTRLLQNGYNVVYTPFTHIYHKGGSTIGGWKKTSLSIYYAIRNKALFQKKFFGDIEDDFFNTVLEDYFFHMRNKELIRAICSAMIDTCANKTGKSFDVEFIQNYKKRYEHILRKRYENIVEKNLLNLYIECMNRPRDKEKFLEFVKFMKFHKEKIYENLSCIDYEE